MPDVDDELDPGTPMAAITADDVADLGPADCGVPA